MEVQGQNRRRHKRIAVDNRVGVFHRGKHFYGQVRSLSEGGLMLISPVDVTAGDKAEVYVHLGNGVISADAVALYALPKDQGGLPVGFRFSRITHKDLKAVRDFVSQATNVSAAK
jgi:hypothetical protein